MHGPEQAGAMDMGAMIADIVPEIILVLGGVAILLYALFAPRSLQAGAALLALATVALATAATLVMLGGPDHLAFAGTYARDGVAIWGKLIVMAATAGVIALSVPWFRSDPRHGEYYTILLFSALGAVLLAGAADLQQFVLALVLSSATGFVLVAYHRGSSPASEAAIKYYLLGAFTSASVLIGVAVLFGLAGSTALSALTDLPARTDATESVALVVALTLVLGAVAFKLGAVPAHAWMPDVAQGAPAPVAAFVTTIPKVGGFIFLARLLMALPPDALDWRVVVAVLATATMTLGNLAALWQDDVRRLLGWSSVSQTGYGLMAVAALGLSDLAVPSLLYFLLAYAVGNIAAFGVVVQLRGRTKLADYAGLARARPWLAGALAISFLSFIGIPPLAGFFAKLVLFGAAIEAGYSWLAVVAAINTVVSIVYYVRVLAPMYFGELGSPVAVLSPWAGVATLALAAVVVVIGLASEPFFRGFADARLLSKKMNAPSLPVNRVFTEAMPLSADDSNRRSVMIATLMDPASVEQADRDPWDVVAARLSITGMDCSRCAEQLEQRLLATPGILSARVGYEGSRASVAFDPAQVDVPSILAAISSSRSIGGHRYRAQALLSIGVSVGPRGRRRQA